MSGKDRVVSVIPTTTTGVRRGPATRRRNVIALIVVVVAVACFGGVIVWRSTAAQSISVVGTWQLVSVQHRNGPVTPVTETDAYLAVESDGMLSGQDGGGPWQAEYTVNGDQLRISHVVIGAVLRPSGPVFRAYDQLFDETTSSIVTVAGDTLTVATSDYTLTLQATTPKPVVSPTLISPSPQR